MRLPACPLLTGRIGSLRTHADSLYIHNGSQGYDQMNGPLGVSHCPNLSGGNMMGQLTTRSHTVSPDVAANRETSS